MTLYMCAIEDEDEGTWFESYGPYDSVREAVVASESEYPELPSRHVRQVYEMRPVAAT